MQTRIFTNDTNSHELVLLYYRDAQMANVKTTVNIKLSTINYKRGLSHILLRRKISAKPNPLEIHTAGGASRQCSRLCLRLCVPLQGRECSNSIPIMNWLVEPRVKRRAPPRCAASRKDRTRGAWGLRRREASRLYGIVHTRNMRVCSGSFRKYVLFFFVVLP